MNLPFVETMITQICNLSCQGCTNYSDLRHSGYVPWSQGKEWLTAWKQKLVIGGFGIMGGEPLINPEVEQWLSGVRSILPQAQIRFTTNGLLLSKHPDLLDLCQDLGNVVLKITVHVADSDLEGQISNIMRSRTWEPVVEHGIKRWKSTNRLRFQVNRPSHFVPPFKNSYHDMAPWNSNPDDAFDRCIQQTCPLMYQGRIYKCSTSALLEDTLIRFGQPNWRQWQPFISKGIGVDDEDSVIKEFIDFFGKPEKICSQCPGKSAPLINHVLNVSRKK